MKTCRSCKHWEQWESHEGDAGSCHQLTLLTSTENDRVRVYDDSMPITTEPNFGCIHHDGKTAEDI